MSKGSCQSLGRRVLGALLVALALAAPADAALPLAVDKEPGSVEAVRRMVDAGQGAALAARVPGRQRVLGVATDRDRGALLHVHLQSARRDADPAVGAMGRRCAHTLILPSPGGSGRPRVPPAIGWRHRRRSRVAVRWWPAGGGGRSRFG